MTVPYPAPESVRVVTFKLSWLEKEDADENDVDMLTVEAAEVSGSTTARTYGLFFKIESGSDDSFFNHTVTDTAAVGYAKPMITIQEMSK